MRLYRILGELRAGHRALGSRSGFFYYNDPFHQRDGITAYRRQAPAAGGQPSEDMIVLLNFSDQDVDAWIPWPQTGTWRELIDGSDTLVVQPGEE